MQGCECIYARLMRPSLVIRDMLVSWPREMDTRASSESITREPNAETLSYNRSIPEQRPARWLRVWFGYRLNFVTLNVNRDSKWNGGGREGVREKRRRRNMEIISNVVRVRAWVHGSNRYDWKFYTGYKLRASSPRASYYYLIRNTKQHGKKQTKLLFKRAYNIIISFFRVC